MQLPYDFYNHITYTYCNPEFCCAQALSGNEIEVEVLHFISKTKYHYQAEFESLISNNPESLKILMHNIRSITTNLNKFLDYHLQNIVYEIQFICFCETRLSNDVEHLYSIRGYNMYTMNRNRHGGGVAMYVRDDIKCNVIPDISVANEFFESLFIECRPNSDVKIFNNLLEEILGKLQPTKTCYLLGDININLIHSDVKCTQDYTGILCGHGFYSCINKPTRVHNQGASLIDQLWTNDHTLFTNCGILITDDTDHYAPFIISSKQFISNPVNSITYRDINAKNVTDLCQTLHSLFQ